MSLILVGDRVKVVPAHCERFSVSETEEFEVVGYEESVDTGAYQREAGIYENRGWIKLKSQAGEEGTLRSCYLALPPGLEEQRGLEVTKNPEMPVFLPKRLRGLHE